DGAGDLRRGRVRVVRQVQGGNAGHVRRGHRGAADGVGGRAAGVPGRGDRRTRRVDVEAGAVVREARARIGAGGRADGDGRGRARRRVVAGVAVVVAGRDHHGDARIDHVLHSIVGRG